MGYLHLPVIPPDQEVVAVVGWGEGNGGSGMVFLILKATGRGTDNGKLHQSKLYVLYCYEEHYWDTW